jgi:5-hydroxyisourate hydrolase
MLTTHVLDTATGRPAAGMRIDLFHCDGAHRTPVEATTTNEDGRCDAPLLAGERMVAGTYELVYHVGDYLRARTETGAEPPFLDHVPIRFGIADVAAHYHVPLLFSPFGYTTYRGS